MIRNRFDEKRIPIDILRIIINRSLVLPIIILINGHGQIGKSTFLFHLANRIFQIKNNVKQPTWNEWNYKKYCSRNALEFVKIYDESENQIIALEEAGEQLNFYEWYSVMNQIFSTIARTQGYKRNIILLITPYANDLQKQQKRKIDFILWVRKKYIEQKICEVVPRVVKINYLSLKDDNFKTQFIKSWSLKFSELELAKASEYTEWLKLYKSDIMDNMKLKVGIYNPNRPMTEKNCPEWVKKML